MKIYNDPTGPRITTVFSARKRLWRDRLIGLTMNLVTRCKLIELERTKGTGSTKLVLLYSSKEWQAAHVFDLEAEKAEIRGVLFQYSGQLSVASRPLTFE